MPTPCFYFSFLPPHFIQAKRPAIYPLPIQNYEDMIGTFPASLGSPSVFHFDIARERHQHNSQSVILYLSNPYYGRSFLFFPESLCITVGVSSIPTLYLYHGQSYICCLLVFSRSGQSIIVLVYWQLRQVAVSTAKGYSENCTCSLFIRLVQMKDKSNPLVSNHKCHCR